MDNAYSCTVASLELRLHTTICWNECLQISTGIERCTFAYCPTQLDIPKLQADCVSQMQRAKFTFGVFWHNPHKWVKWGIWKFSCTVMRFAIVWRVGVVLWGRIWYTNKPRCCGVRFDCKMLRAATKCRKSIQNVKQVFGMTWHDWKCCAHFVKYEYILYQPKDNRFAKCNFGLHFVVAYICRVIMRKCVFNS